MAERPKPKYRPEQIKELVHLVVEEGRTARQAQAAAAAGEVGDRGPFAIPKTSILHYVKEALSEPHRGMVGRWFLADHLTQWQGQIVARASADAYLVQLYSWTCGSPNRQLLVTVSDMTRWTFYDNAHDMRMDYETTVRTRWQNEDNATA